MKAGLLGFRTVQVRSFVFTWDVVVQLTVKLVWSTALQTAEILQAVCEDLVCKSMIDAHFPCVYQDSGRFPTIQNIDGLRENVGAFTQTYPAKWQIFRIVLIAGVVYRPPKCSSNLCRDLVG